METQLHGFGVEEVVVETKPLSRPHSLAGRPRSPTGLIFRGSPGGIRTHDTLVLNQRPLAAGIPGHNYCVPPVGLEPT